MQKPRPKEATAPRQQRPTRETGGSNRGASAPFSVSKGETAPNQPQNPTSSVSEAAVKTAATDPGAGVIRNEAASRPESWEAIRVGDLVIAHESPEDGWWEAIVVAVENDQLLLRWRDYSRQPCVRRGRIDVALLPPVAA
jgi:hypothetical protein